MEPNDFMEAVEKLADSTLAIASAIRPSGAGYGTDATGGTIDSLTEAVMGITSGLVRVADSISDLAEAVREHTS